MCTPERESAGSRTAVTPAPARILVDAAGPVIDHYLTGDLTG
jgi:hypothetical protein